LIDAKKLIEHIKRQGRPRATFVVLTVLNHVCSDGCWASGLLAGRIAASL
jgi:hypothetical protein